MRSGISEATISRMCSDDNFRYDIRQITRIVISLHMPPLLSAAFMESILFPDENAPRCAVDFCILANANETQRSSATLSGMSGRQNQKGASRWRR